MPCTWKQHSRIEIKHENTQILLEFNLYHYMCVHWVCMLYILLLTSRNPINTVQWNYINRRLTSSINIYKYIVYYTCIADLKNIYHHKHTNTNTISCMLQMLCNVYPHILYRIVIWWYFNPGVLSTQLTENKILMPITA